MPPKPAKNPREHLNPGLTSHRIILADAREMCELEDESVHLVVTSPPYANLKEYEPGNPGQMGDIPDYDEFLCELDRVWRECFRVLVPGGRVCCVVGDVNVARSKAGRHYVLPLAGDIRSRGRKIGFDHLQGIVWYKVTNIKMEASNSSRFLGKPNLPGGVIKNDLEYIVFLRKPGYRSPSAEMEELSFIPTDDYVRYFRTIWDDIRGASLKHHPAPYPVELAERLIRMFSFVGDTVVDPFGGSGSTALAALQNRRSSVTYEVEPKYIGQIRYRLAQRSLYEESEITFEERGQVTLDGCANPIDSSGGLHKGRS